MAPMLDHPEKTARLLAALKAAAPFEVELASSLIEYLQAENVADADRSHHVASDFSRYFEVEAALAKEPTNRALRREFNELKKYQDFLKKDAERNARHEALRLSWRALEAKAK
jgi:acyl carrier protein phosphodiesterase